MSTFNTRTTVRSTRKEHRCFGCNNVIPIQSEVIKDEGMIDGEWYSEYIHKECDKAREKYSGIFLDGVREGFVHELVDHFGDEVYGDEAVKKYILPQMEATK